MNRRPFGRLLPPLAVAALLIGAALTAALSSPRVTRVPLPAKTPPQQAADAAEAVPTAPASAAAGDAAAGTAHQLPSWAGAAAGLLCLAFVVVVAGMLSWYLVRDRLRVTSAPLVSIADGAAPERTEDVVAAVDAGLDRLGDRDADPRRAVIACWVRLEEAAAAAGTPRRPGDTPTDLVGRLLLTHRVSHPVLDEFAAVYREARYATHGVDERMRAAAVASLRHLRAELTVRAEVG
ncbi:DUF4129 domain-containing protein [Planosporangium thailandense]|uniref:DUF4129 domain-containing protein n=1 Tax=Planosporangium thailandense TaxID=765197 RepID=A0ABX0XYD6_9ACTN|nr:DUF4129 domain-containing protein [Planosporangium thailandense]NJC70250.1 DUF4129 domain-containing protein [Planosporangium thailandense]